MLVNYKKALMCFSKSSLQFALWAHAVLILVDNKLNSKSYDELYKKARTNSSLPQTTKALLLLESY